MRPALLERGAQRRALAEQMLLANELRERGRTHPHGQRLVRRRHRGASPGRVLSLEKSLHAKSLAAASAVDQALIYSALVPESAQLERRTTELLQRLIRFNTVNPPGNEEAVQEYLRGLLEEAGFECELLSAVEGRPNLVARLRGPTSPGSLRYSPYTSLISTCGSSVPKTHSPPAK